MQINYEELFTTDASADPLARLEQLRTASRKVFAELEHMAEERGAALQESVQRVVRAVEIAEEGAALGYWEIAEVLAKNGVRLAGLVDRMADADVEAEQREAIEDARDNAPAPVIRRKRS